MSSKTMELRGMLDHRINAVRVLREAQTGKRAIEQEITREVFRLDMFDCLSVNWTRLGQTLHVPVD